MGGDSLYYRAYAGRQSKYFKSDERADRPELQSCFDYLLGIVQ